MAYPTYQSRSILAPPLLAAALALTPVGCNDAAPPQETATAPAESAPAETTRAEGSASAALAEALRPADAFARAERLSKLLPTLGPEAIPDVKETLEHLRLDLGAVEFELMLRYWARHDPEAATNWVFKQAPFLYRAAGARTAIEIWAEQEPQGAMVATETALAEAGEDVAWITGMALVRGWFKKDREGVERYIESMPAGIPRQRAIYAYALSVAAADGSDAVIAWGESIPDDDPRYKQEVFQQVMVALTWADIDAAQRFCEKHCDERYGGGLREALTRSRIRNGEHGGDVVAWVGQLSEGSEPEIERKKHSLRVAYAFWARTDRDEAVAWLEQQLEAEEPEPWLRHLHGEYARQIAVSDPARAIGWAERIEEEGDRERTLLRIVRYWMTQDAEAAEAWLAQSPLSEDMREKARDTTAPNYLPGLQQTAAATPAS